MSQVAILLLRFYQVCLSPLLPQEVCRFTPSCSHYATEAYRKYGFCEGSWLTLKRLLRCHPFHPGGVDPVPCLEDSGDKHI